jgi:hypothetical protein
MDLLNVLKQKAQELISRSLVNYLFLRCRYHIDMRSFCRECHSLSEIISYDKGDPVLSCGHIKRYIDDRIDKCRNDIANIVHSTSMRSGRSEDNIRIDILNALFGGKHVGFCPICEGIVALIANKDGDLTCAGDYQANPGCGCLVKTNSLANA